MSSLKENTTNKTDNESIWTTAAFYRCELTSLSQPVISVCEGVQKWYSQRLFKVYFK